MDGQWLRSINLPVGRHELSTGWGVRGLVIAQFSGVDTQGRTVLSTRIASGRTDVLPSMKLRLVICLVFGDHCVRPRPIGHKRTGRVQFPARRRPRFRAIERCIELYNAGAEALNLSGWHFTDNFNDTSK